MILDNLLMFTGQSNGTTGGISNPGNTDSPTTGTQVSTNVVDLGLVGIPASAQGGGARDIAIGDDPMLKLLIVVTTAFAGGTNLTCALQGAPDNGSGIPGAYTTMWTSPAVVVLASLTVGQYLANVDVPRTVPGQPIPRFLRLQFTSVGTFTGGGAVEGTIVIDRFDQIVGTTGALSGYPPGVAVAN